MKDLQARNEKLVAALTAAQLQLISVRSMIQVYGNKEVIRTMPEALIDRLNIEEKNVAIAIDNISRA